MVARVAEERGLNRSRAATLSVALAVLSWPLLVVGLLSQLGDFHPSVPQDEVDRYFALAQGASALGLLCFIAAVWLAAYGRTVARKRSLCTFAICGALIAFGVWGLWP